MAFDPSSTSLLIELGMRYVETGAVRQATQQLNVLAQQARQVSAQAAAQMSATVAAATASVRAQASNIVGQIGAGFAGFANNFRGGMGTPPPMLGQTAAYQAMSNAVVGSLNRISAAATAAAVGGLAILGTQLVTFGKVAEDVVRKFIKVNEDFQGLEITMKSSFQSGDIARRFRDQLSVITAQSPLPFSGLADLTRSLSLMPQTRSRLMEQGISGNLNDPEGFLRKAVQLVEKMTTFRPDKSVADAVYSLREAMGGEFRSLVRRFDIPLSIITQLSGKTAAELKSDAGTTIESLMKVFDKLITTEALRERAMQPSVVAQNILEQLGTVSALRIGDAGIYKRIQDELGKFYDGVQEINKRSVDPFTGMENKDSLMDRYAKPISDALEGLFNSIKNTTVKILEGLLQKFGFGADTGGSVWERGLKAFIAGVNELSEKLPAMFEKIANIFLQLVPLLTRIGSVVLSVLNNVATLAEKFPVFTAAALPFLPAAAAAIPGLAFRGLGMAANYGAGTTGAGGFFGSIAGSFRGPAPAGAAAGAAGLATVGSIAGGVGSAIANIAITATTVTLSVMAGWKLGTAIAEVLNLGGNGIRESDSAKYADLRARLSQDPSLIAPIRRTLEDLMSSAAERPENRLDRDSQYSDIQDATNRLNALGVEGLFGTGAQNENLLSLVKGMEKLSDQGRLVISRTADQIEAADAAMKEVSDRFSGNEATRTLEQGFHSDIFRESLGKIFPRIADLEAKGTSGDSQFFREKFSEIEKSVNPVSQDIKRMVHAIDEFDKAAKERAEIASILTDSSGLLRGQDALRSNVEQSLNTLKSALAQGNPASTRVPEIQMSLGEGIAFYQKILDQISSGSGELSTALRQKLEDIQAGNTSSAVKEIDTEAQIAYTAYSELVDLISKGVIGLDDAISNRTINELRTKLNSLPRGLGEVLSRTLDSLQGALIDPNDVDKQSKQDVLVEALKLKGQLAEELKTWMEEQRKAIFEAVQGLLNSAKLSLQLDTTGMNFGSFTNPQGNVTPFGTTVTRSSSGGTRLIDNNTLTLPENPGGLTGTGDLFGYTPGLNPTPGITDPGSPITENSEAVQQLKEQAEASLEVQKNIVNDGKDSITKAKVITSKGANTREAANSYRELKNTVGDALQVLGGVISTAQGIKSPGPEADIATQQFSAALDQFPAVATKGKEALAAMFGSVREGSLGLDDMYKKMTAVADFSKTLAAEFHRLAEASSDPNLKNQYNDAARRAEQSAAQAGQFTADIDRNNNPASFFTGLQESIGVAQHSLLDFRDTGKSVGDALKNDLGSAFASFITGAKTGKEAFRDFATAIIGDLAKIAAEAAVKSLMGLLVSAFSPAASAASGTSAAALSGGGDAGYMSQFVASGGPIYGGSGYRDDVPAVLTGGEYVINRHAASTYGRAFLDSVNSGSLRMYAVGGAVDPSSPMRSPSGMQRIGVGDNAGGSNYDIKINVNHNSGGKGKDDDDTTPEEKRDLAKQLEAAVIAVLDKQSRPGGRLRK